MYVKLAFRNAKKYLREYLIYCITLTLCVGMFYAFMSLFSDHYINSLPIQYDMEQMKQFLRIPVVIITFLIVFLIKYANRYVLKRKQKELAIQILLGIEQKHAAYLFYLETLLCGLIAIGLGILAGTVFAQFLTAYIMHFYGEPYTMFFSLFPDTVLVSILAFLVIYSVIGWMNIRTIKKMKIVELLHAEKQSNGDLKKGNMMPILMLIFCGISGFKIANVWKVYIETAFETRWTEKLILIVNLVLAVAFILTIVVKLILCIIRRKIHPIQRTILVSSLISFLCVIAELFIVTGHTDYGSQFTNRIFICTVCYVIYLLFSFFYAVSYGLQVFSERSKRWKYRENHLFLIRQITSKLALTSRTMSLLASCIMAAITLFTIGPILTGWTLGYLDLRAVYDIQVSTSFYDRMESDEKPEGDFQYIDDICNQYEAPYRDSEVVELYSLQDRDCAGEKAVLAKAELMSVSDYNHMRRMAGYDEIVLNEDEFTFQWHCQVRHDDMEELLAQNQTLAIGDTILKQAADSRHMENMGEVIYSFALDSVLIVPDDVCEQLDIASYVYLAQFKEKIAYSKAAEILQTINNKQIEMQKKGGMRALIRMRTVQRNEGISITLAMKLMFVYSAFMLLLICFTILSLQQLEDSTDYRQRFDIIRKMGVPEGDIQKIILQQMAVWFLLPIILGGICGRITGQFYNQWSAANIPAYVNVSDLNHAMLESLLILVILLACYFLATWSMFSQNMKSKLGRKE